MVVPVSMSSIAATTVIVIPAPVTVFALTVMVAIIVPVVTITLIAAFADYRLVVAASVAGIPGAVNIMALPGVTIVHYNFVAMITVVAPIPRW